MDDESILINHFLIRPPRLLKKPILTQNWLVLYFIECANCNKYRWPYSMYQSGTSRLASLGKVVLQHPQYNLRQVFASADTQHATRSIKSKALSFIGNSNALEQFQFSLLKKQRDQIQQAQANIKVHKKEQRDRERVINIVKSELETSRRRDYQESQRRNLQLRRQIDHLKQRNRMFEELVELRLKAQSTSSGKPNKDYNPPYSSNRNTFANLPIDPNTGEASAAVTARTHKTAKSLRSLKPTNNAASSILGQNANISSAVPPSRHSSIRSKPKQSQGKPKRNNLRKYVMACIFCKLLRDPVIRAYEKIRSRQMSAFSNIYSNAVKITQTQFLVNLSSVGNRILDKKGQDKEYLAGEALLHDSIILTEELVLKLSQVTDALIKDKLVFSLLKMLSSPNQHFPNNYLTPFQLKRVHFSPQRGYMITTPEIAKFLLLNFLIMRSLIMNLLSHPIKIDPDLHLDPTCRALIQNINNCLYHCTLEVIGDKYFQNNQAQGVNYSLLPDRFKYVPRATYALEGSQQKNDPDNFIIHGWDIQLRDKLKKLEQGKPWGKVKELLQQWVSQVFQQISESKNGGQLSQFQENLQRLTLRSITSKKTN